MGKNKQLERRFFTTSDVARQCEVSNDGVLKWIKTGKLRAFATPGGHYRVSPEDFRDFLERYEIPFRDDLFGSAAPSRRVLIVDDDDDIRAIIRRRLSSFDRTLTVAEATDGYDAGIRIGSLRPDLVILDIMMPRVDGVSLCRSIRGNSETRETKILAITGLPDPENIRRMYEAGADLCLAKPLDLEEFERVVQRLLRSARSADRPSRNRL